MNKLEKCSLLLDQVREGRETIEANMEILKVEPYWVERLDKYRRLEKRIERKIKTMSAKRIRDLQRVKTELMNLIEVWEGDILGRQNLIKKTLNICNGIDRRITTIGEKIEEGKNGGD